MSDISIDRTLWAGFRVAWRNPQAFGLWAVGYLILGLGPSILMWSLLGPDLIGLMRAGANGGQTDTAAYMASMARMNAISGLSFIGSLLVYGVIYPAMMRAVLKPADRAFGYLRLGVAELLVGVMFVAFYFGFVILIVLAMLATALMVIAAMAAKSVIAAVVLGIAAGVATFGLVLWLAVRLSMVMPMIVATGQLDIGKAWTLTRGRAGRLFLIGFLLVLLTLGMSIVIYAVFGAGVLASIGSMGGAEGVKAYFSQPAQSLARDLTPWGIAIALVGAVFGALQLCVFAAPWAEAYRQIVIERQAPVEVF